MRAEVSSSVFLYILAVIVIGSILIFGYKRVIDITKSGDEIQVLEFRKFIENYVNNKEILKKPNNGSMGYLRQG